MRRVEENEYEKENLILLTEIKTSLTIKRILEMQKDLKMMLKRHKKKKNFRRKYQI